uniref:Peroxidase C3 n=2 Tax=Armoracia rusticana TaxID=3704 RepID=PER3_ARMRU|nr:RecName: Full=Peroxidase C3; Flags: Precursor [Armoracia rusticana]BAA14144.1 peroxidase isozyme [Armoracia rusticana]CCJ34824.1 horseradish peroxidase isoenzyme HRP_C3 [Armoracia rusticana]
MGFSPLISCSAMGALILSCLLLQASNSNAQLRPDFYFRTCPSVFNIIGDIIVDELRTDPRIAASLLRLHFHDCFVRGCDASILLDNSTSFRTEKDAAPNANSARGFGVIDRMKTSLERACPRTVSCADVLTIASQISVLLSGGPWWPVPLGRRDSVEAFFDLANTALPSPFFTLAQLKKAFADVGLNRPSDLVALSGGHTFGRAQCQFVTPRLYNFNGTNRPDPTLDPTYLVQLRALCPQNGNGTVLVNFDVVTPNTFDRQYYTNLRNGKGLIQSDQELFSTPGADTIPLVNLYSSNTFAFFGAFVDAMIRMGNLRPLTGTQGEIRQNCRVVNSRIRGMENDDGVVSSI